MDRKDLLKLTEALQRASECDKHPQTTAELQEFVDDTLGVVSSVVSSAVNDKRLTQTMLENAGVEIRPQTDDYSQDQMELQMLGMWHSKVDVKQYEDTQNSYIGSKFIEWMVREKRRLEEALPDVDLSQTVNRKSEDPRNRIANFLPPVDVAIKVYRIDGVNVLDNTFKVVFSVLLDWEDPSTYLASNEGGAFIPEQHFCPKYSIDNCDSSELVLVGGGKTRPRRAEATWHVKWTTKYQAVLKTPLNPENYPFDFQELRIVLKPNTVDRSKITFLANAPYNFHIDKRIYVEFQHPLRWRRDAGHMLTENADWLPDFDIVGIHGERGKDTYTVTVGIKRDPTNIILNVMATMTVTAVISSFSFFISEFADALAVVLTALLTAVAFKLILSEQLPLTPKPSVIETFVLFNILQFAVQAVFNFIIHILSANLAEGVFGPNDDSEYVCQAEVAIYQLFPPSTNGTTEAVASHTEWCNSLIILNVIFFGVNFIIVVILNIWLLEKSTSAKEREILAESSWGCVDMSRDATDTPANCLNCACTFLRRRTRTLMLSIAHEFDPDKEDEDLANIRQRRVTRSRSKIEPVISVGNQVAKKVPSIYNSAAMKCVFTVGRLNDTEDKENHFTPANLSAESDDGVWCGINSGIDPWNPAQRLAKYPDLVARHYKKVEKFGKLNNVQPNGRCMESLANAGVCPRCDKFLALKDKHDTDKSECTAPRTWIIGACICFATPYVRGKRVQVTTTPKKKTKRVSPAEFVETKKE